MTMMGCYERPADRAQHTIRYEALDGAERTLSVSPGATCFASTYAAYELCSPEERQYLDGLMVRYWSEPSGFGRVRENQYPRMSPCGTRMVTPPPKSGSGFQQLDSKAASWASPDADDEPSEDIITLAQRIPVDPEAAPPRGGEPWEGESTEGFLQPLILVQ